MEKQKQIKILAVVGILGVSLLFLGCSSSQDKTNSVNVMSNAKSEEKKIEYEITKKDVYDATTDYVKKANAEKQGFIKTVTNMPLFKEEKLKVVISSGLNENAVKETVRKIYTDETREDSRLDRISVTAYDNKEYVETNANYVTFSYWEKSDKSTDGKDTIAGGQITWSYINISAGNKKKCISASNVTDQEKKIYNRQSAINYSFDNADISFEEKEQKTYSKLSKEFNLPVDQLQATVAKIDFANLTDSEMQVYNAMQKKYNDLNDSGKLSGKLVSERFRQEVAKQFKISTDEVMGIYSRAYNCVQD